MNILWKSIDYYLCLLSTDVSVNAISVYIITVMLVLMCYALKF